MKPVASFNPDGHPWCPTQVDSELNVMAGKWILCEDERAIIYDGSGAGFQCPIPFIINRVHYDYCTKKKKDGGSGNEEFYWCPDPNYVLPDNVYNISSPIGKCTTFLFPPGNA